MLRQLLAEAAIALVLFTAVTGPGSAFDSTERLDSIAFDYLTAACVAREKAYVVPDYVGLRVDVENTICKCFAGFIIDGATDSEMTSLRQSAASRDLASGAYASARRQLVELGESGTFGQTKREQLYIHCPAWPTYVLYRQPVAHE